MLRFFLRLRRRKAEEICRWFERLTPRQLAAAAAYTRLWGRVEMPDVSTARGFAGSDVKRAITRCEERVCFRDPARQQDVVVQLKREQRLRDAGLELEDVASLELVLSLAFEGLLIGRIDLKKWRKHKAQSPLEHVRSAVAFLAAYGEEAFEALSVLAESADPFDTAAVQRLGGAALSALYLEAV